MNAPAQPRPMIRECPKDGYPCCGTPGEQVGERRCNWWWADVITDKCRKKYGDKVEGATNEQH